MKKTDNKPFRLSVFSLVLSLVFYPILSLGGEIYKWVDAEGIVHMTDSISGIPPQYRDQVQKRTLQITAEPDVKPEIQKIDPKGNAGAASTLKRFEVPYRAFEGTARRIILPVTFNESVPARLLLDTGSPGLVISPSLADRLGLLDEQDGHLLITAGGIGGSAPAILAVVNTVSVGEAHAEFLPATITEITSDDFEGLVGMDFVANYRISIDTTKNVLVFDELPPQSDRPGGHDEAWWRHNFELFSRLRTEWGRYLEIVGKANLASSETEKFSRIAKSQYLEADKLFRKLEIYARDNAVPINWRH